MKPQNVRAVFEIFSRLNPKPETELKYTNPFTLLVAVVLSAQATDAGVNKATPAIFEVADTPQKMLDLGEEKLKDYVKSINFFRNKAKNIIRLSEILVSKYRGIVPADREALESLPGVGRKSANVILNVCFGEPVMAVDTHIFRVANRTGLAKGKTPFEVEQGLMRVIPTREWKHNAHHWLVLHGRYICKAKRPLCPTCPIVHLCEYPDKTQPEELVKKPARQKNGKKRN